MARKRMVTRTIKVTKVTALTVDLNTEATETVMMECPCTFKDEKGALDYLNANASENVKFIAIRDCEIAEHKYGMSESAFITCADILDTDADAEGEE